MGEVAKCGNTMGIPLLGFFVRGDSLRGNKMSPHPIFLPMMSLYFHVSKNAFLFNSAANSEFNRLCSNLLRAVTYLFGFLNHGLWPQVIIIEYSLFGVKIFLT